MTGRLGRTSCAASISEDGWSLSVCILLVDKYRADIAAFIVPALYEAYAKKTPTPIDEYTLSAAMGANLTTQMEQHYATFIVSCANTGLNVCEC